VSEPPALGRIVWWGDRSNALKLLPSIETAGLSAAWWPGRNGKALNDSWAAVLFLPNGSSANWSELAASVVCALDTGVNVIVVRPEPPEAGSPMEALRSRLRDKGVRFAGEQPDGDPDQQQRLVDLPLCGGEVRETAFSAGDLLRMCHPPARRLRRADLLKFELAKGERD
jgi:hypothetical protein